MQSIYLFSQTDDYEGPQCSVIARNGSCDYLDHSQNCRDVTWSINMQVVDSGSGINQVYSEGKDLKGVV